MIWKKRGEADGLWHGPLQVVIQENSQVMWVTGSGKLYRIAPEHVRPLSAVEEVTHQSSIQAKSNTDVGQQSIIPSHGGVQFHNLLQGDQTSIPNDNATITHSPLPQDHHNFQVPINTDNIPANSPQHIPSSESEASQQPDDEPSARAESNPEIQPEVPNPVEVPVPDDSDDGLVCEECWHVEPDHAWCFEVDICQQDIQTRGEPS